MTERNFRMGKNISGLYLILDQRYASRDIVSIAEAAVEAGVDVLQYREKIRSKKDALTVAKKLRDVTGKAGIIFIVNDDPAIALAVDADGVHLGQEDIPAEVARKILGAEKIIGISTHSDKEALAADRLEVDYIGFGPIFHSSTKMVALPHGPEGIKRIRNSVSVPIIAIGGITEENAADVMKAGASGVAVISAILSAQDIKEAVREFKKRMKAGITLL